MRGLASSTDHGDSGLEPGVGEDRRPSNRSVVQIGAAVRDRIKKLEEA